MKRSNYALIVAHPDDEIIFASSLIKNAKKIIIIFSDYINNKIITNGRKNIQKNFPLKNTIFFNIPQAKETKKKINWYKVIENEYGIEGEKEFEDYRKNFINMKVRLIDELYGIDFLYTHSPWGEYGHPEHIQVFKAVMYVSQVIKSEVKVFGYFSSNNFPYLIEKQNLLTKKPEIRKTNIPLFMEIRNLYFNNNCWTWYNKYLVPSEEYFYTVNQKKYFKNKKYSSLSDKNYFNYICHPFFSRTTKCIKLNPNFIISKYIIFQNKNLFVFRSFIAFIYRNLIKEKITHFINFLR